MSDYEAEGATDVLPDKRPLMELFERELKLWLSISTPEHGTARPFWIDTLCVPVKSIEGRKAAIRKMHEMYKHAESVLLLDRSLQECSGKASPTECLIRIAMSSWSSRLWTLQEAALARNIYFDFGECILDGHILFQDHIEETESLETPFCRFLLNTFDMLLWMPVLKGYSSRDWMKICSRRFNFVSRARKKMKHYAWQSW